jgi:hypothetical protein
MQHFGNNVLRMKFVSYYLSTHKLCKLTKLVYKLAFDTQISFVVKKGRGGCKTNCDQYQIALPESIADGDATAPYPLHFTASFFFRFFTVHTPNKVYSMISTNDIR